MPEERQYFAEGIAVDEQTDAQEFFAETVQVNESVEADAPSGFEPAWAANATHIVGVAAGA